MTHEMIKRVAAAIAEPQKQYVIKCNIRNQWQLWLIDFYYNTEKYITSYGKYDSDHEKAERECEQLNNELLARFAIDAMKKPTEDIMNAMAEKGLSNDDSYSSIWLAAVNAILQE